MKKTCEFCVVVVLTVFLGVALFFFSRSSGASLTFGGGDIAAAFKIFFVDGNAEEDADNSADEYIFYSLNRRTAL